MSVGDTNMNDTKRSAPLVALGKGGGPTWVVPDTKLLKVDEGEGSLPCRRTDRLSSDANFPDNELLPCAAPFLDGGEHS